MHAGEFYSRSDLLRFYSNAGAAPGDEHRGYQLIVLPEASPDSRLPHYNIFGLDVFALDTAHAVLGGCGGAMVYSDSCGGVGFQNLIFPCAEIVQ